MNNTIGSRYPAWGLGWFRTPGFHTGNARSNLYGLGGLRWEEVEPVIKKACESELSVRWVIFPPKGA
jgi:hypothetical protein